MRELLVKKLPRLTAENIDSIMRERIAATKNSFTSIPMLWQGFLEIEVQVGASCRTAKLYIPPNTPQGTTFILMNTPQGKETLTFLNESGWVATANRYRVCIFAAEAGINGWSAPDEELHYFFACMQTLFDGVYFRGGMSVYVVGYGEVGIGLHKTVLASPLKVAAAAFVNASDIDAQYIEEIESRSLDGNGRTYGITLKEIPVPIWIMEKQMNARTQNVVRYWVNAIGAELPTETPAFGKVYAQKKETVCTPDGKIVLVCVKEVQTDCFDVDTTAEICDFLTGYSRYGKLGPFGNSLVRHVADNIPGLEIRYFVDGTDHVRECLIYVPKERRSQGKLPMVFAVHGACESVRNYFEESLWFRKADQEEFIVVMPEATLEPVPKFISDGMTKAYRSLWQLFHTDNKDSDLKFFSQILDKLLADYPVDPRRIYCTGHSMGCMMTNFIGSSKLGSRFAALAATSGVMNSWDDSGSQSVPIWLNMGQYDLWNYDIAKDNEIAQTIDKWLIRNGIAGEEAVKRIRLSGISERYTEEDRNCVLWKNDNGLPLVCYEWIMGKDHMNTPEDNRRFWDQWFSKWVLDENLGRCFEGEPIEALMAERG